MRPTLLIVMPVIGLALFLSACGSGATPAPPDEEVIVSEDVRVLDEEGRASLRRFELDLGSGAGALRFEAGSDAADALEVGTIVASEPVPGVAPHGFLQRIEGKRSEGGEVVVETSQANLLEAIGQAKLELEQELKPSDLVGASLRYHGMRLNGVAPGVAGPYPNASTGFAFELEFDEVLIDQDGDASTTDDLLQVDGSFRFDATASAGIDICFCGEVDWAPDWAPELERMYGKARLDESVEVNLTGELAAGFDERFEVARLNFGSFTVMAGPVPVVFVIEMVISIGANGQFEAQLELGATQTTDVQVGIEYTSSDGWRELNDFDFGFDFPTPQITASASARAFLRPQLDVMIYGLAGPYLYAEPYVEADAQLHRDPFWRFTGGIDVGIGFRIQLPLVGTLGSYETTLVGFEETLQESANEAPKLEVISPLDGSTLDEGSRITFNVRATDREQATVTFRVTDGSGHEVIAATELGPEAESFVLARSCVGVHTYHLTVEDARGETDEAVITTSVVNVVPTLRIQEQVYAGTPVYAGGWLPGSAEAYDTSCQTDGNGADGDLIEWFVDGSKVGTGERLTHFLDAVEHPAGSTVTVAAAYSDGVETVRTEDVLVDVIGVPAGQAGKPQAVILEPFDGAFIGCYLGVVDVKGMGYVLGGGMLGGSSLRWEVSSGGGFVPAGSGENATIRFAMGDLDANNTMTIQLRLTATDGADSATTTSSFQAALCG